MYVKKIFFCSLKKSPVCRTSLRKPPINYFKFNFCEEPTLCNYPRKTATIKFRVFDPVGDLIKFNELKINEMI